MTDDPEWYEKREKWFNRWIDTDFLPDSEIGAPFFSNWEYE